MEKLKNHHLFNKKKKKKKKKKLSYKIKKNQKTIASSLIYDLSLMVKLKATNIFLHC